MYGLKIGLPHTLWTVMHVWMANKMSSAMIFPNTDAARNANEKNVVIALATKPRRDQIGCPPKGARKKQRGGVQKKGPKHATKQWTAWLSCTQSSQKLPRMKF